MDLLTFLAVILFLVCGLQGFFLWRLHKKNKKIDMLYQGAEQSCTNKDQIIFDLQDNVNSLEEDLNTSKANHRKAVDELESQIKMISARDDSIKELNEKNKNYLKALEDGRKAVDVALKYEEFYNSTLEDIGEVVDMLDKLVGKRQMLSDDPDVQNLLRIIAIAHDTLLGYINVKLPEEESDKKKEEESTTTAG